MSTVNIEIGRINVALHGVSTLIVEEALSGLEQELSRRVGVCRLGDLKQLDLAELSLPTLNSEMVLDPAALRGIIAERLVQALLADGSRQGGGGD